MITDDKMKIVLNRYPWLLFMPEDTKTLREEFVDELIFFYWNKKKHEFESWYCPGSSAPYKICSCDNVSHAMRLMRARMKYDKMRADLFIKKLDEYNDKLEEDERSDAMHRFRHDLYDIAKGKKHFLVNSIR